ncbi:MAG: N-6 DNA methylase, partial [Lactobacillus iners]|nr:N-6 DNA methylase [Lactobacillus iners]
YGNNYSYNANKPNSLRVQKALFQQKKTFIENCLYGVDLNPNSVNICRLRLWIELLKNAYYSEGDNGERYLTTLPNIDINIKVGDSLIHRYDLTDKFDLRKKDFKQYVELVKQYKDTSDKGIKSEINGQINSIKSTFVNSWRSPEAEKYDRALAELAGTTNLFDQKVDNEKIAELRQKVKEAKESFENRKGDPLYNNALEWRLEFPEVLDQDGNFVGFDIVIANPPYIFARNQSFDDKTKQYYLSHYEVDEYQANTYTLFMELGYKLLKKNGTFAYIIPNNMLTIQSNQKIRDFLLKKSGSLVIINSLDKIFADANVDNCLVFLKKEKSDEVTVGELNKGDFETVGTVDKEFFGKDNPIFSISMVKYRDAIGAYWKVNNFESIEEKDYAQVKTGIKAYQKGKGKPKQKKSDGDNRIYHSTQKLDDTYIPYVDGNNVSRYLLTWNGEYIKYGENLAEPRKSTNFKEPRILVRQIPSKSAYSINGVFTEDTIINDLNSMVIENIIIKPLALLGIINSKIETLWFLMHFDKFQRRLFPQFKVNELAQFPVPDLNSEEQNKIADKVSVIMSKAKSKQNYSRENLEVDELVMDAYGLTEEEKQEVRDFTF